MRLEGKYALVTGGNRGIGKELALRLADEGASVAVCASRSVESADAVAEEIRTRGREAIAVAGDVSVADQVDALVKRVLDAFGTVDILVNNAGILRDKSFSKVEDEDFRMVLEVHLMGSVNCTKAVWEIMKEQNYGRIVMTSSSSGLYGNFGQTNYGAAKMGVVGLMNTLKLEGAKYNVKCCLLYTSDAADD